MSKGYARRLPSCLLLLGVLMISGDGHTEEAGPSLTIIVDDNQPLSSPDVDGQPRLLTVEMLRQAAEDAGLSMTIRLLPWQRAYRQVERESDICLSGMVQTAQAPFLFKWVGPVASPMVSLFGLKDRHLAPATMAEVIAMDYHVGTAQDDIARALQAQFPRLHIDFMRSQDLGPKMLASRRIDLWVASTASGTENLRREGVDAEDLMQVMRLDIGLGCSLSVDEGKLAALQMSIDRLKRRQTNKALRPIGLEAAASPANRLGMPN